MAKNGQKWPKIPPPPKVVKNGQKWSKMAKNGQKWPKTRKMVDFWGGSKKGQKRVKNGVKNGVIFRGVKMGSKRGQKRGQKPQKWPFLPKFGPIPARAKYPPHPPQKVPKSGYPQGATCPF